VYDHKNVIEWKKVVRKMQQKYIIKMHIIRRGYKNLELTVASRLPAAHMMEESKGHHMV
jgi:hypothetical protein